MMTKRLVLVLSLVSLALFNPVISYAITPESREHVDNNAPWEDNRATGAGNTTCNASNIGASGLPPDVLAPITALQSTYISVAQAKNVPWQMLAAIDYREDNNDPTKSALSGEDIGSVNPDNGQVTSSKEDSLNKVVELDRALVKEVYGTEITASTAGDDIKKVFIAHNRGHSYKEANVPPDASPYVMNMYDAAHQNMTFPNINGETLAGRTDSRYGAYTIFSNLGGCGATGNKIVDIAKQELALGLVGTGPEENGGPVCKYQGPSCGDGEQWCADFVSWVYNAAGSPFTPADADGWRIANVGRLREFLMAHGTYTPNSANAALPQPGDIIIFGPGESHTGIVEKAEGSTIYTIEGNAGPKVSAQQYDRNDGYVEGWGRPGGGQSGNTGQGGTQ